jgi:transcriptional regulator with XRE-family HTH domain
MTKHLWQLERTMTPVQYAEILKDLGLSLAASARYLGVSTTTAARYKRGSATVPAAHAMLLRACRDLGVQLIVPPWKRDPHKHW